MCQVRKPHGGFTLLETMLTVVVLGLAVTVIAGLYYEMQQLQGKSQHLDLATRAAQTEIEVLRNNSYNSLTPGSTINFTSNLHSGLPPDKKGEVKISQPTDGLRRVDVTITYHDGSTPEKVKLSSTIGVIGIGK
jgi:prepilin-type N-terminal cleavage/methylation domain-containing protein